MKSLRFPFFLLFIFLLLLHLAPAEVTAQESQGQGIILRDLWIFPAPSGDLWRTDGTAAGTFRLAPACAAPDSCRPIVGRAGGRVFFLVEVPELSRPDEPRHQLWATDGSRPGTRQLTAFPGGLPGVSPFGGDYLPAPGLGRLFFRGSAPATGAELWVSDGTPAGTRRVADLSPGPADGLGRLLADLGGWVLFEGITPRRGVELWRSDGTAAGTRLLRDFVPGPESSGPRALASLGGQAFLTFTASTAGGLSRELWVSDGTFAGNRLLHALEPPPPDVALPVGWSRGVAARSQVFVVAQDVVGIEMPSSRQYFVRSDGTPGGTYPLRNTAGAFAAFGDGLLFVSADPDHGREPWLSDGTPEGTRPVADLEPGIAGSDVVLIFPAGDLAYLLTDEHAIFGGWVTDGTTAGTSRYFTFPHALGASPSFARGPEDRVFFQTLDPRSFQSQELWATPAVGGPPGSTTRLLGPSPVLSLTPVDRHLLGAPLGGVFLFIARDAEHGAALWESDGTPAGTFPLAALGPPPGPETLPGPVARLTATPVGMGSGEIALTWTPANRARFYEVQQSSPDTVGFEPDVTENGTSSRLPGLVPGLPYAFRVRGVNEFGAGPWTEAAATPLPALITPCVPGGESLCLHGSRFEVKAAFRDHVHGGSGTGRAAPLPFSDDSGTFWFFTPNNLELMVKVLDARVINGHFWSFFGGLTSLETWITITDTEEQTNLTFHKGVNDLCGQADAAAFPRPAFEALATGGTCEPGPDHLCLTDDRYRVEVTWRDPRSGDTGVGHALPGTEDSGFFWFFDDENVELLVKVLDATTVNGHVWVFFGSMTDVEYALTVTDTRTGERVLYVNPPGGLCGQADVAAF